MSIWHMGRVVSVYTLPLLPVLMEFIVMATKAKALDDPLLGVREAAELLSVDVRTMEYWRMRGAGPAYYRVGVKTIRYARKDLEAFIAEGRTVPALQA